ACEKLPIKKFRAMATSRNSRVKHRLQVITTLHVRIPAAIDLNFRQFLTGGKLFFAKLSFGFSKESGVNRN
ncbi:MAG: hypothetical protein SGI89_01145, partial [bacterium]|nr:hypothetical protein [bacterium]